MYVTGNAYEKGIIDATIPFRDFLKRNNIHDYDKQPQNTKQTSFKKEISTILINTQTEQETTTSMYRPQTKQGDPRLWFKKSKKYIAPNSLLAIIVYKQKLYVLNLSDKKTEESLLKKQGIYKRLSKLVDTNDKALRLKNQIHELYKRGFLESISHDDHNVGDTLEYYLGLPANSSKKADFNEIELKTIREGKSTRLTLFGQAPNWNKGKYTKKEMFHKFAYYTEDKCRYDLNVTLSNKPNKQGLYLEVDFDKNILYIRTKEEYITQYSINHLINRLEEKHPATFWIEAETKIINNKEYFLYYKIEYTKKPNSEAIPYLLSEGIITLDFIMHSTDTGTIRDHGFPFKLKKKDERLIFSQPEIYDFREEQS